MVEPYTKLATLYDTFGLADFSTQIIPTLLDYALSTDWIGRSFLDLGCGTGAASVWLANEGYNVTGVDKSVEMLQVAQNKANSGMGLSLQWKQADILQPAETFPAVDMVVALDVLNELESIKEIQTLFQQVRQSLKEQKLWVFDMYTIEGLAKLAAFPQALLHDSQRLTLMTTTTFDYERQMSVRRYLSYISPEANVWRRAEGVRVLRAYPIQAIITLLQRVGFSNIQLFSNQFTPLDPRQNVGERVIFYAGT
jgi:predicted TPR repeat methyltransferase